MKSRISLLASKQCHHVLKLLLSIRPSALDLIIVRRAPKCRTSILLSQERVVTRWSVAFLPPLQCLATALGGSSYSTYFTLLSGKHFGQRNTRSVNAGCTARTLRLQTKPWAENTRPDGKPPFDVRLRTGQPGTSKHTRRDLVFKGAWGRLGLSANGIHAKPESALIEGSRGPCGESPCPRRSAPPAAVGRRA